MDRKSAREMLGALPIRMSNGGEATATANQMILDYITANPQASAAAISTQIANSGADLNYLADTLNIDRGVAQEAYNNAMATNNKYLAAEERIMAEIAADPAAYNASDAYKEILAANAAEKAGVTVQGALDAGVDLATIDRIFSTPAGSPAYGGPAPTAKMADDVAAYYGNVMQDKKVSPEERLAMQKIATDRGLTYEDIVAAGVDPNILYGTLPAKKEEVKTNADLDFTAETPPKIKGGDGTEIDPFAGGTTAAERLAASQAAFTNPIDTPGIYAAGAPALDQTFRDSEARTEVIEDVGGQQQLTGFDYRPAAQLLSATGSGFSFMPPSVTSRPRTLMGADQTRRYRQGQAAQDFERLKRSGTYPGFADTSFDADAFNQLSGSYGSMSRSQLNALMRQQALQNRNTQRSLGSTGASTGGTIAEYIAANPDIEASFKSQQPRLGAQTLQTFARNHYNTLGKKEMAAGDRAPFTLAAAPMAQAPTFNFRRAGGEGEEEFQTTYTPSITANTGFNRLYAEGGPVKKPEGFVDGGSASADLKTLNPDDPLPLFITETVEEEVNPDMVKRDIPRMEWDGVDRPTPMRPETESKNMLENIISGAGKIPDSVGNYFVRPDETGGPSLVSPRQVGSDLVSMGGAMYEGLKEDPVGFALDVLPVTGEIISGTDAVKFSGLANESRAAGDTKAADLYEQIVTLSAAGTIPLMGMGARLSRRATIKAAEEAIKKGALGDAAKMLEEIKAIDAWHGSPHEFKKFRSDKIGTGEGAQMYGSGIYLADASNVAKTYQPRSFEAEELMMDKYKAAERAEDYETMEIWESAMMHETPAEIIKRYSSSDYPDSMRQKAAKVAEELKEMPTEGGLYNVALGTTAENLLDWDAPLSKQSEAIQNFAAEEFTRELGMPRNHENWDGTVALNKEQLDSRTGATLYNSLTNRLFREGKYSSDEQAKAAASSYLNEIAEIDGIQYLDQASRDAGEGTRNYVVFDENLITIKPDDFATESAKMLDEVDAVNAPRVQATQPIKFTDEYAQEMMTTLPEPVNTDFYKGADVSSSIYSTPIGEIFNRQIFADPEGMVARYNAIPDTEGGKVLDTDLFRELSPNYLADRTLATEVHEAASALNRAVYNTKLAETAGQEGTWIFTGGGPASGKSSGPAKAMRENADLIYDGSMSNFDSMAKRIDAALDSGKNAKLVFIDRAPEKAIDLAVGRAMRQAEEYGTGRTIPKDEFVRMHLESRETIKKLAERYKGFDNVTIQVIDNNGNIGDEFLKEVADIPDLDYNESLKRVENSLEELQNEGKGRISQDIYDSFNRVYRDEQASQSSGKTATQQTRQSFTGRNAEQAGPSVKPLEVGVDETLSGGQRLRNYTPDNLKTLETLATKATAGTRKADALINAPVEAGSKVGIRLNLNSKIPDAPKGLDKLQTLHKNNFNGKALSYVPYATVENVTFNVNQKGRQGIAAKISNIDVPEAKNKFPAMSVDGNYVPDKNVLLDGNDFVEIGFNPKAHHLFIDMNTGQAVKGADLATVVGDRVYAKGIQYYKKSEAPDPLNASDGTDLPSQVRYQKMKRGGQVERVYNDRKYI